MTRKHFQLLADAMHEALQDVTSDRTYDQSRKQFRTVGEDERQARLYGWAVTLNDVATALGTTNPRFDRDRFYHAAGWAEYMAVAR